MKSIKSICSFFIILSLLLNSCSKSDGEVTNENSLSQVPIAKSKFDKSNFGIYKGVFVGSSGTIIVNVNNDNTLSATLIINGITYNFTTNETLQQNKDITINFVSGSDSLTFSVSANGDNPTFTNLNIDGHPNAAIIAVKETSTTLIKCYEGTYSGGDHGVFNALIYGNVIKGLVKSSTILNNPEYTADGTVNNNQINATGNVSIGATFIGTLNGDNFSGTWNYYNYSKGTWTGNRTY
jgi:hypothetical protein